ncbi:hypothetical protein ACFVWY_09310 [Streptomyces sp. NPDC058195]|uniref:hypothetical protein n=1 Tax=Streptomyces sp. NPDC058195 TaxID=3346375 RepID=UPI0036EA1710
MSIGGDVAGEGLSSTFRESGTRLNPDGTGYVRFTTGTAEGDVVVYTVCAEMSA